MQDKQHEAANNVDPENLTLLEQKPNCLIIFGFN